MRKFSTAAFLGLTLSAGNVFAQSAGLPDGFYIDGYIDLSYSTDTSDHQTSAFANLDMGIRPDAGISGIPLGFSLGIDAIEGKPSGGSSTGRVAFYPAVTFGLGANGLVSVGIPRSVANTGHGYVPDEIFANSYTLSKIYELGLHRDSFVAFNYLASTKVTPYGVRYDGSFGNLNFGASYHHVDGRGGNSDADAYALAFRYNLDGVGSLPKAALFGSFERYSDSDPTGTDLNIYTLGGEAGTEQLAGGIILHRFDTTGGNVDLIEAYGTYKFTEQFSTKLSVLNLDFGRAGSILLYGLGLEYQILDKGYLSASITDSDSSDSKALYEISAGWRF